MPGRVCRSLWARRARLVVLAASVCCLLLGGCAALTNPVADGIPVRKLPPELLGESRENLETIPLNLLRQPPPDVYRLGPGDVLGVYIEGVLGDRTQPPPIRLPESGNLPPAFGYPTLVHANGTVTLPLVEPIRVEGLSLTQAQEAIVQAYTVRQKILQPGRERIIVTLMQPRTYHVLVVRQDSAGGVQQPVSFAPGITAGIVEASGGSRRGAGFSLDLPAYENDVLNALTRTGGLPGLDARNEVIIQRGGAATAERTRRMPCAADASANILRIPLRLPPGAPIPFSPEDVILQNGDIVFIESREVEVFYTGGLLNAGQYALPRDYDLNVVEAIAMVRGSLINGAFNINNFSGQVIAPGIGFPNPSLVTILRRTHDGRQVAIRVDLNRALEDPRERIIIQPKDLIILQQTMGEALASYFTSTFFRFNFLGIAPNRRDAIGTYIVNTP
jgi:protein involved in polysaccharide export with SLBB domain